MQILTCPVTLFTGITWKLNGAYLDTSRTSKYKLGIMSPTLTIMNVDTNDSGTYICVVDNYECTAAMVTVGMFSLIVMVKECIHNYYVSAHILVLIKCV